ncbi:MAG: T9SS type A sorting domain-containing protein [Bacteroidetes bacterium]|nr:T9SS type A sorting domain-containing protein [Bacteroidota bacterium]
MRPFASLLQISLFLLLQLYAYFSTGQVVINELMAANASTIEDPDFGNNADWIELFNPSPQSVDLSGFYLSDDLNDNFKWALPDGITIASQGYLLVWTDGNETGLHSNFKLSKSGEKIGLFDASGELLDSIIFTEQTTDVSFGRITDGADTYAFFQIPTPGAANGGSAFAGTVFYQPKFSVKGGVYENAQQVELSSIGGVIHYTLNGTEPTEASPIYTSPIFINITSVLRARVLESGKIPGKVVTHSYFFNENFDTRKLPVVSIVSDPDYFWSPDIGLYQQDFKPEWEYPINVELFENDGNNRAAFNETAGVKLNGNNSWQFPQKILGIYFRNDYGKKRLEYPIFFEQDRSSFDYFALRASGNDQGDTFIRDGLIQRLTEDNMDFELQGFRPASVYVNGEYLGLHNIRSKQNKEYIEYYFGYGEDEIDIIKNNGEVDTGDDVAFQELYNLLSQDLSIETNYNAVEAVVDMQNLIDYFIAELWASNRSWGHNIKIWKPRVPGSKWRFILKDLDRGMYGSDNNTIDYFTDTGISPSSYEWARVILRNLLENENFVNRFVPRFADQLYATFHPNRINTIASEMKAVIENEIPYHLQVWMGMETSYGDAMESEEYFHNEVLELSTFGTDRPTYLYRDIADHFDVSPLSNLGIVSLPADGGEIEFNSLKIPSGSWSGRYFQDLPITVKASDGVGHEFQGWSWGTYDLIIPKGATWKYFDNGTHPGANWNSTSFNDAFWNSGPAQFGYGEGDEQTTVSFGDDPDNKFATTYFRKTFDIGDPSSYTKQLIINLMKDDGVVIYLNGKEITRTNMPFGNVDENTVAYHTVESNQEDDYQQFVIQSDLLQQGENTLAVELHQRTAGSSDLSFDLEFLAIKKLGNPIFSTNDEVNLSLSSDTVLIANFQPTGVCILPQIIDQPTTLTIDCSPYHAKGDLKITPNTTLTIEPGVEIWMPEGATITIQGDLQIQGTPNQKVKIIPNTSEGATSWGNLSFDHATEISNLTGLEIKGATKGHHPVRDAAAISIYYSQVVMNDSKVTNDLGNLISAQYSNVLLNNSFFHSDVTGEMIQFQYGTGRISNCNIKGNTSEGTTAILLDEVNEVLLQRNKVYDFFGGNSHGIEVTGGSSNIKIEENFIHNNTDKGILIRGESQAMIVNNTFVNCHEGIAVKEEGNAIIDQNTFYSNELAIRCFEKDEGTGGGVAEVTNSILSNSAKSAVEVDAVSSMSIDYSLSDTEELQGNNNLFSNPLFVNPTQNDFQLQTSSPGIVAGWDGSNLIDLGTKSHEYTSQASPMISAINYHPLENPDAEYIEIYNPSTLAINLNGFQLSEAVELTFSNNAVVPAEGTLLCVKDASLFQNTTQQVIEWESGKLNNAGEAIHLIDQYGIVVDQVIYDDEAPWSTLADGQGFYLSLINPDWDNHFSESWKTNEISVSNENLEKLDITFLVYPNPVSNLMRIESKGLDLENLQIFNTLGQIIFQEKYNSITHVLSVDVSKWERGVYFLKINDSQVGKVIVQD